MYSSLYKISITTCLLATLTLIGCKEPTPKAMDPIEINFKKEGSLTIYKGTSDTVLATLDIEIADNDYETQTGLMYRKSMDANHGMLFVFEDMQPRSFYMKNTYIPLDIIYLNSDGLVVSIQENATPLDETSLPSKSAAQYVLEVNAGLSAQWGLTQGDRVDFTVL